MWAEIASAAAGMTQGIYNIWNQDRINKQNWDRNMELQRETWKREDTAVQRRVADLKAAGLSPVLAAGSAAQTSSPISSSSVAQQSNAGLDILSAIQQKANISATNAGTELTKFQQNTEKWKQDLMQAQVSKTIADTLNLGEEKKLLEKRNNIFDLDAMSQINLRNKQAQNYIKNAELLGAQTIFQQTALDKLKTETDIAKIQREMDLRNLNMFTWDKLNQYQTGTNLYNFLQKNTNSMFGGMRSTLNGYSNPIPSWWNN